MVLHESSSPLPQINHERHTWYLFLDHLLIHVLSAVCCAIDLCSVLSTVTRFTGTVADIVYVGTASDDTLLVRLASLVCALVGFAPSVVFNQKSNDDRRNATRVV